MKIKYIAAICIVSLISLGISIPAEASCGGKKHQVDSDSAPTQTNPCAGNNSRSN